MPAKQSKLISGLLMICALFYGCQPLQSKSNDTVIADSTDQQQASPQESIETNTKSLTDNATQPVKKTFSSANKFNRLLKNKHTLNNSLSEDGIHDPNNPVTAILQSPHEAFASLPRAKSGNSVDWVKALESEMIKPRSDLYDPELKPLVMDLNIIREVKGSMPDVVFPHKQHTQILDCTNCHPSIFIPQKGANKMSMAKNLMGEMCGVCHGKVAFPLSRCTSCHSKKKPSREIKETKWKWP
ncbi:MAG: cytochrome c, class I [Gammaproteobacteria bacterium]|nr:cytochrome c, class I [Gammaproteobacteria bacterium]